MALSAFQPGSEQIMDAEPLVPGASLGVIGAPRAAGVGKDENALLVIHEGLASRQDWRRRADSRRRDDRSRRRWSCARSAASGR